MLYQLDIKLFKTLNEQGYDLRFEQVTVLDQIVCTRRQLTFKIYRKKQGWWNRVHVRCELQGTLVHSYIYKEVRAHTKVCSEVCIYMHVVRAGMLG